MNRYEDQVKVEGSEPAAINNWSRANRNASKRTLNGEDTDQIVTNEIGSDGLLNRLTTLHGIDLGGGIPSISANASAGINDTNGVNGINGINSINGINGMNGLGESKTPGLSNKINSFHNVNNNIVTHGYVHGHVHQHNDHMHIHGHIHNHDHVNRNLDLPSLATACKELDHYDVCLDIFCDELDNCYFLDCERDEGCDGSCKDGKCGENCAENCDQNCESGSCESGDKCTDQCFSPCESASEAECCHDPGCLQNASEICMDEQCMENDHHENSLCELQKPKMAIFEDLIQNVHKNIEELLTDMDFMEPKAKRQRTDKKLAADEHFQIHFPHHCHSQHDQDGVPLLDDIVLGKLNTPVLLSSRTPHNMHQLCFHARVPRHEVAKPDLDFDFFIQFNNFKSLLDNGMDMQSMSQNMGNLQGNLQGSLQGNLQGNMQSMQGQQNLQSNLGQNLQGSLLGQGFQLEMQAGLLDEPMFDLTPLSYACKWEHCLKKVTDSSLVDHVMDAHLKNEYQLSTLPKPEQPAFECEWDNCNFVDQDLLLFLHHLNTHKSHEKKLYASPNGGVSPLLTPTSINPANELPVQQVKMEEPAHTGQVSAHTGVNITAMKILPKTAHDKTPLDPHFTCRWQVGTDALGQPIACNKTHANEGELQHHLQDDHIGSGKPVYQCCWIGCDRNGGKPFVQRQKLFRHIHIHTHYKPCECKVCGAKFAVPAMLKQHMRTHLGEKPFECGICGKKFTTSSSLLIHNRVHSGERPLECKWPGCGKRFSESSNLAKHMRVHTKTFSCEVCGEVFDKKTAYTKHKKEHARQSVVVANSGVTIGV